MDILDALLLSVLMGAAVPVLTGLFSALVHLVAHSIIITEQAQVAALDRLLSESGWCSTHSMGASPLPANGVHFMFIRWPIIAVRTSEQGTRGGTITKYTTYSFGAGTALALRTRLLGDPRAITMVYVYAPAPWRTSTTAVRRSPPARTRAWQSSAVNQLWKRYDRDQRATALVCGGMGRGKSSLGELLAVQINARTGANSEVIKNLDLTMRGFLLDDAFGLPTVLTPVIVMLDEFDAMVAHAERTDRADKSEGTSLADTPTSLLAILDRMHSTPHLVVIATTNKSLAEMRGGIFARYVRAGRFDIHRQV